MRHVVNYSGGDASRYTALMVAREHGIKDLWLLFADVFIEDQDLYRVLIESAAYLYGLQGDARMNALYDEATALHLRIIEMQIRDKRGRLERMEKR